MRGLENASWYATVRQHLPLTPEEVVVCSMSIGYEDTSAPKDQLRNRAHAGT
jgi:hypothetical protein